MAQLNTPSKKLWLLILASLICGSPMGVAAQKPEPAETPQDESAAVDLVIRGKSLRRDVLYGETVNRFFAPQIHDWVILDQQRLILYATRSRPYLVTLRRKAMGLTQSTVIGLQRSGSSIDARFDQIYVDGFPYAIERIEKLSVDTAKRLRGLEVDSEQKN